VFTSTYEVTRERECYAKAYQPTWAKPYTSADAAGRDSSLLQRSPTGVQILDPRGEIIV
jgi:hypothetical protein